MKISWLIFIGMVLITACRPKTEEKAAMSEKNSIVIENANEGTTAWLIDVPEKHCDYPDHQYCRRAGIEGFCSKASYNSG